MSDFTFNPRYITKSDKQIIEVMRESIKGLENFKGVGQEKVFTIKFVGSSLVKYIIEDKTKSKAKPEELSFDEIMQTFRTLKSLSVFNTNTIILKERFPSNVFKQKIPLFGMLLTTEIILVVE